MMIANGTYPSGEDRRALHPPPSPKSGLGELWVKDECQFFRGDVTLAPDGCRASCARGAGDQNTPAPGRTIPLGQDGSDRAPCPSSKDHFAGRFRGRRPSFRRHGQMGCTLAIGLSASELLHEIMDADFAMVGFTCGTEKSVDNAGRIDRLPAHEMERGLPSARLWAGRLWAW